jgi:hypothetical protein
MATTLNVLTGTPKKTVEWDIYYTDRKTGRLRCMNRNLPPNMSKQSIHDYVTRMGHTIEKAISNETIYIY